MTDQWSKGRENFSKKYTQKEIIEFRRKGGLKGGVVRAKTLSPERRSEIARMGGKARHAKKNSKDA